MTNLTIIFLINNGIFRKRAQNDGMLGINGQNLNIFNNNLGKVNFSVIIDNISKIKLSF